MSDADDTLEAIRVADLVTWDPSDTVIAKLVRKLRNWPSDTPVSDSLIREFRSQIWSEARKKWRAQRTRRPSPPTILRGYKRRDLFIIMEILGEPHARPLLLLLVLAADWSSRHIVEMIAGADPNRSRFRPAADVQIAPLLAYARSKIGSRISTQWVAHAWAEPANPWHVAALNGVSLRSAIEWEKRLTEAAISAPGMSSPWLSSEQIVRRMLQVTADYWRDHDASDNVDDRAALAVRHRDVMASLFAQSKIPCPPSPSHRLLDEAWHDLEALGRKAVALAGTEIGGRLCEPELGKPRGILPDPPLPDEPPAPVAASGSPLVPVRL